MSAVKHLNLRHHSHWTTSIDPADVHQLAMTDSGRQNLNVRLGTAAPARRVTHIPKDTVSTRVSPRKLQHLCVAISRDRCLNTHRQSSMRNSPTTTADIHRLEVIIPSVRGMIHHLCVLALSKHWNQEPSHHQSLHQRHHVSAPIQQPTIDHQATRVGNPQQVPFKSAVKDFHLSDQGQRTARVNQPNVHQRSMANSGERNLNVRRGSAAPLEGVEPAAV